MSNAVLGFGSWCRRGAAALIERAPSGPRVVLKTDLHFKQDSLAASKDLELYGPGEITGFDARAVTRTWPGRNVNDAEASSFAHIEFDQADLPWRYTPFGSRGIDEKPREHVLSFPNLPASNENPLPTRQQFSNDGVFWVWEQTPPPIATFSTAHLIDFTAGKAQSTDFTPTGKAVFTTALIVIGSVDFDEPVVSVAVTIAGNANVPKDGSSDAGFQIWTPTLLLEGFAGADSLQQVTVDFDGAHIGTFTITAPATNPMTRFVMSAIVPLPRDQNRLVRIDISQIAYTTAARVPDVGPDRLRPWCVLIVLRPEEIVDYRPAGQHGAAAGEVLPLPVLTTRQASLPDLSQSWAWAHVQVSGRPAITPAEAIALFETAPQTMLSRLICPRQLEPGVAWRAFLVPAFERGQLAGLGLQPVTPGATPPPFAATIPAWGSDPKLDEGEVVLPVYYEWEFQTAANVDFESLVRLLRPKPLPPDVGARPVDAYAPDPALPPASVEPLSIEGALKSASPTPPWQPGQRGIFVPKLTALLNAPGAGPPLYGRWLAARDHVQFNGSGWLDTVNADLRYRIAAGAAQQIVQEQEDKLLAGAWRQIDGLPEINETLRFAQFARTVARRIRDRRLNGASPEAFLYLTAPLFRRVKSGGQTIARLVANSPIGRGPFEPGFRRLLRRFARRRQQSGTASLLERMNRFEIAAAPRPARPRVVPLHGAVFADKVRRDPPRPNFGLVREVGPGAPPPVLPPLGSGAFDSFDAALFRFTAVAMLTDAEAPRLPRVDPVPLLLDDVRRQLSDAADPSSAMLQSLQSRLHVAPGFVRAAADPLEPILASVEFDNAMYGPLRQLSEEWILPGVSKFPSNTISLAVVNQAFIEAYLLGLSHELARSLLWNAFPTDQRGTYFRQFWESGGYIGPRTREELRDIRPIDAWSPTNVLGANSSRPPLPNGAQPLVLLLRADVLRQYPTAVVYAARAVNVGGVRQPADPPVEKQPIFRGRLGGDIAFFGFELTADEARSSATDEGWFFILQEQPNEPRFGLEPGTLPAAAPAKWADLRWAHFGATRFAGYINLDAALPDTRTIVQLPGDPAVKWHANQPTTDQTGTTSAQLAWITLRRWERIAIHADRMLEPRS